MEPIVITSRSGVEKYELPYEDPVRDITTAKIQRQHMANDYVQISVHTTEIMSLEVGDWIEVRGCRYSIRAVTDITRSGEDDYVYNITFFGKMYDLMRYSFRNAEVNGRSAQQTFDLTLSLADFIQVIVNNVLRAEGINSADAAQSPWIFDDTSCPDTDPITMSFDRQNCLTALQNIVKEFGVEFRITQEYNETYGIWQCTIHVGEFGTVINSTPFSYGEGNGLYQLQESKVDDSCIVNRLWAEGSTENILSGYRGYSSRLQLPRKNVPLLGSGDSRRYSRNQHSIEIDGEKIIFKAGYPIGINSDDLRYVDETTLYEGSQDASHGMWKKEGDANWRYSPFNPSGLITNYGVLESSEIFDEVAPSPTFNILKLWPSNGASLPNSRQSFFCDVNFDLSAIWADSYSDFLEWCLLKTQFIPTEAQYNACKEVYDDSTTYAEDSDLWQEYRREIGDGTSIRELDPYAEWRQTHHSASMPDLPTLPAAYDQDIYAEYDTFRKYLVSADNSKYLIDGGTAAFIDGKCAGIDFTIGSFIYQTDFTSTQRQVLLFSSSESYSVGDICMHSVGGVYKAYQFISAHTGSWSSSDVVEINIGLLTINTKEEQDTGDIFPSEDEFGAFRLAPGDQFKLVSIYFPYSYYEDAEEELWFAAYEKFEGVKYASMQYKLSFDRMFVGENKAVFESILPGDYITISDDRFGLTNKKMRVTQVDCDLINDTEYQITLQTVHKQRTRSGWNPQQFDEVWRALSEVGLDDPHFRRNNRASGSRAIEFITSNGNVRSDRIADQTIQERMIANLAVSSGKIASGAVNSSKLASSAVTADKVASGAILLAKLSGAIQSTLGLVPVLERFANNGYISDRHFTGKVGMSEDAKRFTIEGCTIIDSLSKERLGFSMKEWTSESDFEVNFDSGDYEADKSYKIYSLLKEDGTCEYGVIPEEEETPEEALLVGVVGPEDGEGARAFTPDFGDTYMENGVIKDGDGTAILDIKNGILKGGLKISGLKDAGNEDTDIVSILGALPTTAGGVRKLLADAVATIGDEATQNTLLYRAASLEGYVGEDEYDEGGLLYRASQLESRANIHYGKVNELIDSIYSANQILVAIQNNFNTLRNQLLNRSLINQSGDTGTVNALGIAQCTWNPLQQEQECISSPTTIGIPDRLQE